MSVECSVEVKASGQEPFHALDGVVMRHVFDIHNTLGRFRDERIYQEELAQRCRGSDFEVDREVLIGALHEDFAKPYYSPDAADQLSIADGPQPRQARELPSRLGRVAFCVYPSWLARSSDVSTG